MAVVGVSMEMWWERAQSQSTLQGSSSEYTGSSATESSWEVSMSAVPFMETLMAGLEERERSSVSVVRFGLESMTEDMIGREVEEEWDCSETVIGMSGLEQREDGSVSMVSGMQGRGVGDKQVSEEAWWRDGGNDVGWEVDLAGSCAKGG